MRSLARDGRTILVSSHLMSEMQLTADNLLVIGRGRLLADAPMGELLAEGALVRVRCSSESDRARLAARLPGSWVSGDCLLVPGAMAAAIGDLAFDLGVRVHELAEQQASLEQRYMELTADAVEYGADSAQMMGVR